MKKYAYKKAFPKMRPYRARLLRMPQSSLKGLIRSAAVREERVVPSVKSAVRRYRIRLLSVYKARFGNDQFVENVNTVGHTQQSRRSWLNRGYPNWRSRLTLNWTRTPGGAGQ